MKGLRTTCLLFSDPKAAQVIAAAGSEDLQHFMSSGGSLMLRRLPIRLVAESFGLLVAFGTLLRLRVSDHIYTLGRE